MSASMVEADANGEAGKRRFSRYSLQRQYW
jgi:hypothetical protein